MDTDILKLLSRLIRDHRTAALGTLHDAKPFVSMVVYAAASDFSRFYLHVSGLSQHTRDMLRDPRVSLLIAEADEPGRNPLQLARLSVIGEAVSIPETSDEFADVRALYLERRPESGATFELGGFSLFGIRPERARLVAGFGRAVDLHIDDFIASARAE